jgi:hypothetical protein
MKEITITEALAEIKVLKARIEKKISAIRGFLTRRSDFLDPLEKDGGSPNYVAAELQSIHDLSENIQRIRTAIQRANHDVKLTLRGTERSIQGWLNWRREVAPLRQSLFTAIAREIDKARPVGENDPQYLVNVDEKFIAAVSEQHVIQLEELDGKLSLLNATVLVTIPESK